MIAELDADVVALQEFTYPADVALETRTPVVLTTLETYQCALGPDATEPDALLRQRGADAPSDSGRAPHRSVDGAARAARRAGGDHRRRRRAAPPARDAPRAARRRTAVPGRADPGLPGFSRTRLRSSCSATSTTGCRAVRSCTCWTNGWAGRDRRSRFRCAGPLLSLDRIWVRPQQALQALFAHTSATARVASDHLPVVADIRKV